MAKNHAIEGADTPANEWAKIGAISITAAAFALIFCRMTEDSEP